MNRRIRVAEFVAVRMAEVVITHSAQEAELLRAAVPGVNVHVLVSLSWSRGMNRHAVRYRSVMPDVGHVMRHDFCLSAQRQSKDLRKPAEATQDPGGPLTDY
jgi:hypothetical protein